MAKQVKPISPGDVVLKKAAMMPSAVIESFNELIAQKFDGSRAYIQQKEIVAVLENKGLDKKDIFEKHWLDVEDIYRKQGWKVEYDSPAYCESYEPSFTFSK